MDQNHLRYYKNDCGKLSNAILPAARLPTECLPTRLPELPQSDCLPADSHFLFLRL